MVQFNKLALSHHKLIDPIKDDGQMFTLSTEMIQIY